MEKYGYVTFSYQEHIQIGCFGSSFLSNGKDTVMQAILQARAPDKKGL